uniref:NAD-dependent epimerase/dehydratase domain-containing protein n=1 Tax=Odontella aurita TaxID=265563 RepID=A0A7S4HM38_9STRA
MTGVVTVIITGGGGFLGQCLASSLLSDPKVSLSTTAADDDGTEPEESIVERIVLADVAFPPEDELQPAVARGVRDGKIECRLGSVADESFCSSLVEESSPSSSSSLSVFHLGAVMSGTGESDFDLCMNVNLRGTMTLLERCRSRSLSSSSALPAPVRFVYASAGATVGSGSPTDYVTKDDTITDAARSTPHTTYGMTKACGELLLSDYSRRGFVDGRGARLPTVVVRAGRPNAATTGCFSGVVRETLGGIDSILPIGPDVKHAVTGMRNAVDALRTLHDLPTSRVEEALGYDRTVFLPATALSLSDLEDATKDAVSPLSRKLLGRVEYTVDEFLSGVVGGFPTRIDAGRARELGVGPPPTPEDIVRDYAASFPEALAPGLELSPKAASAASADGSENKDNDDDDDDNNNVVAVITGAGSGIGRAVALRLAQGGWGPRPALDQKKKTPRFCLVLAGRRKVPLEETAALVQLTDGTASTSIVSVDVTDETAVRNLFQRAVDTYGRVDLLFNNAGTNVPPVDVVDYSVSDFRRILDTNLTASFLCAREAMRIMSSQRPRGGRIINNGSISAHRPRPGGVGYTCSKHGVIGLTKTLALEGRRLDVAVGQIDFGNVTTAVSDLTQGDMGAPQADGTILREPQMSDADAADTVAAMAALPLGANVLSMTVMATNMPYVGRG